MTWIEPYRNAGGRLGLQAMIFKVSSTILARARIPKLWYSLGIPWLGEVDEAYGMFERLMRELLAKRETEFEDADHDADSADRIKDVLGRLVGARRSEGSLSMSDDEIIGNCLIFVRFRLRNSLKALSLTTSTLLDVFWTR